MRARTPTLLFPLLVILIGLAPRSAAADDAVAERRRLPAAVGEWDYEDGIVRVLVQPEFREAIALRDDLLALKLEGLAVELVTPWIARPSPLRAKAPSPVAPARLLLLGPRPVVDRARLHVDRLDVPPRMVSVSILLSEVRLSGDRSVGSSLLYDKDGVTDPKGTLFRSFETGFTPDRFLISSLTGARPFEGTSVRFGDGNVLGGAWETTLRMLATRGEAQWLAWPNLLCTEGRPAEIQALENLPHIRLETAGATPSLKATSEEVGLRLGVTATRVGAEHAVLDIGMWLTLPEAPDGARTYPGALQLKTREVTTRVTVRAGEPLLLGGLYLRRWARTRKGLPRLEGLSLVDALLFADDRNCVDTELVLLIRARIRTPSAAEVRRVKEQGQAGGPPPPPRERAGVAARNVKRGAYDPFSDPWRPAEGKAPAVPAPGVCPGPAPRSSADLDPPPTGG